MTQEAHKQAALPLEANLQAHIGRRLRGYYDGVVAEAVPDRFAKLLEELARREIATGTGRSA